MFLILKPDLTKYPKRPASGMVPRPGVKACCALVDAWGSRGEAAKAAELLEELEDRQGGHRRLGGFPGGS